MMRTCSNCANIPLIKVKLEEGRGQNSHLLHVFFRYPSHHATITKKQTSILQAHVVVYRLKNLLWGVLHGVADNTLDVVAVMALDLIKEREGLVLDDF